MPWIAGVYSRLDGPTGWQDDANASIPIQADLHDDSDNDVRDGINQCLNKDGSNAATGNLNIGNNKLTNVATATLATDAATLAQVQSGASVWGATSAGTANAQTIAPTPAIAAYAAGQRFTFIAGFTNTAATPTLAVSGLAAKNIFLQDTSAAAAIGDIRVGQICDVVYDGTQFLLANSAQLLQSNVLTYLGAAGGTANALTLTPTIPLAAYGSARFYTFSTTLANTGACTINISGLGVIPLVNREGNALKAGALIASRFYRLLIGVTTGFLFDPSQEWQTWASPNPSQGVAVSHTIIESKFKISDNNECTLACTLSLTGAGTANNSISCDLPVVAGWTDSYATIGACTLADASANANYTGSVALVGSSFVRFFCEGSHVGGGAPYVGSTTGTTASGTAPLTLASGDKISFTVTYRI